MRNRLHSICPYFAMFPETFVREHLNAHTAAGDCVLDPFSGRGTTVLEALLMQRRGIALDINPVAYCLSAAKAEPPGLKRVLAEIESMDSAYRRASQSLLHEQSQTLPAFFRRAFHYSTLRQLLFLRRALKWRSDPLQRFIAALSLGSLHGEMHKTPFCFSNRMPRTISPKPRYALKYWNEHGLWPEKREVFSILRQRAEYRLSGELPLNRGKVVMSDARLGALVLPRFLRSVGAVITSPPYFDVTNFEEDQWLRLWFLGYKPHPTYGEISTDDRHSQARRYWLFLQECWNGIAPLLKSRAVVICRLRGKKMGIKKLEKGLSQSLSAVFPRVFLIGQPAVSAIRNRQTDSFRPGSRGCVYEVDFTFQVA